MKTLFAFLVIAACVASYDVFDALNDAGYKHEKYEPITPDGFKITFVRITQGKTAASKAKNKPVVLLQHGLLDQCGTWVANSPSESLGFILVDAGYDVFLGNVRGNNYASTNVKLSPSDKEYWQRIDYDYMISDDIPTMINEALRISGKKSLSYVGHSQGTLIGFGAFSSNKEIAKKVNLFVALAPVAYIANVEVKLIKLLAALDAANILEFFGEKSFLPPNWFLKLAEVAACKVTPSICENILGYFVGSDPSNLNATNLPHILSLEPGGTSVQNMAHWAQGVNSKRFQKFDFGKNENMKRYNSPTPPQYNLTAITQPPIAIFSGWKDLLADPADVKHLYEDLPDSNKPVFYLDVESYDHMDFIWGVNAKTLIYPQILKLITKYNH